tara:strand:+ start:105 stop:2009 length:1905 start_codon:yes stop_codon:yes gene_type:complete
MSNSGKVWDIREYYKLARNNQANDPGNTAHFGQGYSPSLSNNLFTVNLSTLGNATDFGDATTSAQSRGGTGTLTKGFNTGGRTPDMSVVIDTVDYRSLGNATDFGDLSLARAYNGACTDNIRVVIGGGNASPGGAARSDTIDYITAASTGNAADFGNLSSGRLGVSGGGDNTRGIFYSGYGDPGAAVDRIDFITFTSVGNAIDFGNAATSRYYNACDAASTTRTISGGGAPSPGNVIEFVTTQTTGNGTDFGDLTASRFGLAGSANGTRMIFAGGTNGAAVKSMDFVTVASSGNATDFGDMDVERSYLAKGGCNGNGGLPRDGSPQRPSVTYMPGSGRMLLFGGYNDDAGAATTDIDMITIPTLGNAVDFGTMTTARRLFGGFSDRLRATAMGGVSNLNSMETILFSSFGNTFDFGDLTTGVHFNTGLASVTRGINAGGITPSFSNVISYVTIASASNATDFGDLTAAISGTSGASSSVRGIFAAGNQASPVGETNVISYITIASTGNATDFGDTSGNTTTLGGTSSSTRAVYAGGSDSAVPNEIQYVTIASTGNTTDFGDLTQGRGRTSAGSNSIRGVFGGGTQTGAPAYPDTNVMDYITIASTGNAADFGDLTRDRSGGAGCSDNHGGLQIA